MLLLKWLWIRRFFLLWCSENVWDKAAEIQTWEEWSNPTPVVFLLLTKYIYVDSLWMHVYADVGRQTPTDAVYAPGWPDTSQLVWKPSSLSRTASQDARASRVHRTGLPCTQVQSLHEVQPTHVSPHIHLLWLLSSICMSWTFLKITILFPSTFFSLLKAIICMYKW